MSSYQPDPQQFETADKSKTIHVPRWDFCSATLDTSIILQQQHEQVLGSVNK